jgi:hypothetical protein
VIPKRIEPARSVRIAVPAYASLTSDTERSIKEGVAALVGAGIEVQDLDAYSCCYIDYSRNILAARFMQSPATDLVFIDSDVGFEPEELVRLCVADRPFCAGIYPKKTEPEEYPVAPEGPEIWADKDGFIKCLWMPTGFMRINRAVFEELKVPTYADSAGEPVSAYFLCSVRDGGYWGEDVEFCRLVREAGGEAVAFSDMTLRHVSQTKTYEGNWGRYLTNRMKEAA